MSEVAEMSTARIHGRTTTEQVIRPEDGELLGYVRRVSGGWQPLAVFGGPLGAPCEHDEAVARLRRHGLEYLADPWQVYWPADDRWYTCTLQEVSPGRVRLCVSDFGSADYGTYLTLVEPGPDRLRPGRTWS